MGALDRRQLLRLLGSAPLAAGFVWTGQEVSAAQGLAQAARATQGTTMPFEPRFFTPHEWETVRVLVDLIIPKDDRSGGATDAGVPEFLDFLMIDEPRLAHESGRQTAMRGGLAWIDLECQRRFDKTLVACTGAERTAVLDDISSPPPEAARDGGQQTAPDDTPKVPVLGHGQAFFSSFRDLTATGFWTTKMGMEDLQYQGNRYVAEWNGCPDEALKRLGVSYPPA
ncbi:MAG: gluconate 2-dehydrogenase subunit 3 family protein [Acidobacteriota bacterium]|nr:gluconate 2-dehydrogenase subunit 3 family protein [Acidobacteriota bacterium]